MTRGGSLDGEVRDEGVVGSKYRRIYRSAVYTNFYAIHVGYRCQAIKGECATTRETRSDTLFYAPLVNCVRAGIPRDETDVDAAGDSVGDEPIEPGIDHFPPKVTGRNMKKTAVTRQTSLRYGSVLTQAHTTVMSSDIV